MENSTHLSLVGVKSFSNDGVGLLRRVFSSLATTCTIQKISSVYRIEGESRFPAHVHDLRRVSSFDGLSVVTLVETQRDPRGFLELLQSLQRQHESLGEHRSVSINLLSFDDLTIMTEELTLPHPEFHENPETLFPAVEIWPELIHPVLNESLKKLTRRFANLRWGEFHTQGKSLLDFLPSPK